MSPLMFQVRKKMKTCILMILICIWPYYGAVKSHNLNQVQGQGSGSGCNSNCGNAGSGCNSNCGNAGSGWNSRSTPNTLPPVATAIPVIPSLPVIKPTIKCGTKARIGRIVGGSKASPKSWPWQIGIKSCPDCMYFCGGTIVAKRWVITAAHCVENNVPSDLYIEAGVTNQKKTTKRKQSFNCTAIYKHQSYGIKAPYDEDIAVLRLSDDVVFNDHVRPLCLNTKSLKTSQRCSVTGYGKTSEKNRTSVHLRQADVPIVAQNVCAKAYRKAIPPRAVTGSMLCAGYKTGKIDACGGDSGGPLTCWDQSNHHYVLGGIVSWGVGCARKYRYGVYTDVRHLKAWITRITGPIV